MLSFWPYNFCSFRETSFIINEWTPGWNVCVYNLMFNTLYQSKSSSEWYHHINEHMPHFFIVCACVWFDKHKFPHQILLQRNFFEAWNCYKTGQNCPSYSIITCARAQIYPLSFVKAHGWLFKTKMLYILYFAASANWTQSLNSNELIRDTCLCWIVFCAVLSVLHLHLSRM